MRLLHFTLIGIGLFCMLTTAEIHRVLATIHPCHLSLQSISLEPVYVTTQLQQISTCTQKSICVRHRCSTGIEFVTFAFVSTTIPCAWNGTTASTLIVTRTDQPVVLSEAHRTLTREPTTHSPYWLRLPLEWRHNHHDNSDVTTVLRRALAPYKEIGSFAIPGWSGSGLCDSCVSEHDIAQKQRVVVLECFVSPRRRRCLRWIETWISYPTSPMTTIYEATISTEKTVSNRGTYVWALPQTVPAAVITAPVKTAMTALPQGGFEPATISDGIYSFSPLVWKAHVTRSCTGPTTFTITIYVTKTITFTAPFSTAFAPKK